MSIRHALLKAASLFAEIPEADEPQASAAPVEPAVQPRTVQDVVNATPGPKLEEISLGPDPVPTVAAPGGMPDFRQVYLRAGLPEVKFTAEQAHEVIGQLPADLPIDVRRRTVQATLQTMGRAIGVNTDAVLGDATRKLAALAAYEDQLKAQTAHYTAEQEAKIADLQKQIEAHKQDIAATQDMLKRALEKTTQESEKLDDVLEFFTQDVAPSKYAPPSS